MVASVGLVCGGVGTGKSKACLRVRAGFDAWWCAWGGGGGGFGSRRRARRVRCETASGSPSPTRLCFVHARG